MMASCWRLVKKAKGENTAGPNWLELPIDVTTKILNKLSIMDIVTSACLVCPLWWNICKDPLMWRTIDMTNLLTFPYDLENICCYAVDRSCGLVEDISIEGFGTDELLKFIADRASNLRRFKLACCRAITDKGFGEVAKKCPLLEELDISSNNLSKDCLQVVGSCPLLKTLKFNIKSYYIETETKCDDEVVIAKNMPELRQIRVIENRFTDDSLVAILDGCPHLESLELHGPYVDLDECLRKRCVEQIKDLRPSNVFLS